MLMNLAKPGFPYFLGGWRLFFVCFILVWRVGGGGWGGGIWNIGQW